MTGEKRRLASILGADVVGDSAQIGADEPATRGVVALTRVQGCSYRSPKVLEMAGYMGNVGSSTSDDQRSRH